MSMLEQTTDSSPIGDEKTYYVRYRFEDENGFHQFKSLRLKGKGRADILSQMSQGNYGKNVFVEKVILENEAPKPKDKKASINKIIITVLSLGIILPGLATTLSSLFK